MGRQIAEPRQGNDRHGLVGGWTMAVRHAFDAAALGDLPLGDPNADTRIAGPAARDVIGCVEEIDHAVDGGRAHARIQQQANLR